jgi:hypothetical protein
VTILLLRSLRNSTFVTDYPGQVGEVGVTDDERSDEVGVRRRAVLQVGPDGLVEGGVAGREDGRVVDQAGEGCWNG